MIIKFICSDESLRIFETNEVSLISGEPIDDEKEYRHLYDAIKVGDYQLFIGTPEDINTDKDGKMNPFKVLKFCDSKDKQRTILFDNVVYLMNEQGKTVDTIYGY